MSGISESSMPDLGVQRTEAFPKAEFPIPEIAGALAIDASLRSVFSSRIGLATLVAAILLGVLSDALFHGAALGINLGLWLGALALPVWAIADLSRAPVASCARWFMAAAIVFALCLAWRDSSFLADLNLCLMVLCLVLATSCARPGSRPALGVLSLGDAAVRALMNAVGGCGRLLFGEVRWSEFMSSCASGNAGAVLRGALISIPFIVLFGALFVSADAAFQLVVERVAAWLPIVSLPRMLSIAIVSWFIAGFLRQLLFGAYRELPDSEPGASLRLGAVETIVVLIALNALFAGFVITQVPYFFGGMEHVFRTADLTLAQYARRGFFELTAVASIALPMLLCADWIIEKRNLRAVQWVRLLSAILIGLLFVIMGSAMNRMRLYMISFGLTELRFYVTAFIIFLAALFVWFGLTVLRGERRKFYRGALLAGLAAALIVQAANPVRWIVRSNLAFIAAGKETDVTYVTSLGGDAIPEIVKQLPHLPDDARKSLASRLEVMQSRIPSSPDWRSWNWGRANAATVLGSGSAQPSVSSRP